MCNDIFNAFAMLNETIDASTVDEDVEYLGYFSHISRQLW